MDQSHRRRDVADLAALERADEVPVEQVAVRGLLGEQVLRAVLADQRDPCVGELGELVDADVLRRCADLDVVADARSDPLEVRPDALYVSHAIPAWRPVTPPSRRCEKNRSGRQLVHMPTSLICSTPPASSLARAIAFRSIVAATAIPNAANTSCPTS